MWEERSADNDQLIHATAARGHSPRELAFSLVDAIYARCPRHDNSFLRPSPAAFLSGVRGDRSQCGFAVPALVSPHFFLALLVKGLVRQELSSWRCRDRDKTSNWIVSSPSPSCIFRHRGPSARLAGLYLFDMYPCIELEIWYSQTLYLVPPVAARTDKNTATVLECTASYSDLCFSSILHDR